MLDGTEVITGDPWRVVELTAWISKDFMSNLNGDDLRDLREILQWVGGHAR